MSINFGSFDIFLDVQPQVSFLNHHHLVNPPFSLTGALQHGPCHHAATCPWTPAITPQVAREGDWNCKMCHLVTVGLVG